MTFVPDGSDIIDISRSNPAIVTTDFDHFLSTGQVVRINVPRAYGMIELSGLALSITVLSNVTFSLQYSQIPPAKNVDSTQFTAFVLPATPQRFTAEVIAIGSGPTPILEPTYSVTNNLCETSLNDATYNNSTVAIPLNGGP